MFCLYPNYAINGQKRDLWFYAKLSFVLSPVCHQFPLYHKVFLTLYLGPVCCHTTLDKYISLCKRTYHWEKRACF